MRKSCHKVWTLKATNTEEHRLIDPPIRFNYITSAFIENRPVKVGARLSLPSVTDYKKKAEDIIQGRASIQGLDGSVACLQSFAASASCNVELYTIVIVAVVVFFFVRYGRHHFWSEIVFISSFAFLFYIVHTHFLRTTTKNNKTNNATVVGVIVVAVVVAVAVVVWDLRRDRR
jgi:heme/copper-type cytochrome/quinol oxidase subunit 4